MELDGVHHIGLNVRDLDRAEAFYTGVLGFEVTERYAENIRHLMLAAVELYPHIPVVMHQDHGNSPDTCFSAIRQGFTSVMMDGSLKEDGKSPADFDYNVRVTRKVVDVAHSFGVSVEGELGCL